MSKPPIPSPPRQAHLQFLADVDGGQAPARNLAVPSTTRAADLNFKVTDEFHRSFKAASAIMGISMKELLEESFRLWLDANQVQHVASDVSAGVAQERSRGRVASGRNKPPSRVRRTRSREATDLSPIDPIDPRTE